MHTKTAEKRDFSRLLKATPTKPGVYLMRDLSNEVLYIGKATNLRHRLRSYFNSQTNLQPKIRKMVSLIADFEFILTESESEALILECNLIKQYRPQYNARLKDDKSYPFIKIDTAEDFPQVYVTRNIRNDGSRYFGPFASASSVRRTLALLKKLFPYRSCTKTITGSDIRPCLDFHINRCVGPCTGAVNKEQYAKVIDQVVMFLEGKTSTVAKDISKKMREAANNLEFERATILRDQYRAIEKVHEGQKVLHLTSENIDVISIANSPRESWVEIFFIREGKLIGRDHFIMSGTEEYDMSEILSAFMTQFYHANPYVPKTILVEHQIADIGTIQTWLEQKRQGKIRIHIPVRGEKRQLMNMVSTNALEGLEQLKVRQAESSGIDTELAMTELQEALNLPRLPRRIECYDISNTQGSNAVGSMIVFVDGNPLRSNYRRFTIKSVRGIDDYSMMKEMLTRRFKRLAADTDSRRSETEINRSKSGSKSSVNTWNIIPDLVLIDGGRGHLNTAVQVLLELGISDVPLASLAKENEELFVPDTPEGLILPRNSKALFLAQQARDEAHRFAVTFHRSRRSKSTLASAIRTVPGIGPKKHKILIRTFGSTKGIKEAPIEDLAAAPGMTMKLAVLLKDHL